MMKRDVAGFYQWGMDSRSQSETAVNTSTFAFRHLDVGEAATHYLLGFRFFWSSLDHNTRLWEPSGRAASAV